MYDETNERTITTTTTTITTTNRATRLDHSFDKIQVLGYLFITYMYLRDIVLYRNSYVHLCTLY